MRERNKTLILIASVTLAVALLVIGIVCVIVHENKIKKVSQSESISLNTDESENSQSETETETTIFDPSTMKPVDVETETETETEKKPENDPNDLTGEYVEDSPYYITVNRTQNIVIIYTKDDKGQYTVPIKAMVCSVGLGERTPVGEFTTSVKWRWAMLNGDVYGQYVFRFKGPYLFHSVPYYSANPSKLETEEYNKLGEKASLGCVRLTVEDAKWLVDNIPSGTKVKIYDSDAPEPLPKPVPVKIDLKSPNKGWDPTDPSAQNPWLKTPPTFTNTASIVNVEVGSEFKPEELFQASDYRGRQVQVKFSGAVNVYLPGDYTYQCEAMDANGNIATKAYTIRVQDTTPPDVRVSASPVLMTVDLYKNTAKLKDYLLANLIVTDNAGPEAITKDLNQYDLDTLLKGIAANKTGTANVRYTVKDSKNTVSGTMTVAYLGIALTVSAADTDFEMELLQKSDDEIKTWICEKVHVETNVVGVDYAVEITNWNEIIRCIREQEQESITVSYKVSVPDISGVKEVTGRFQLNHLIEDMMGIPEPET